MPPTDDFDPIQDAKFAREAAAVHPERIPARPVPLAELHRRWMHARLALEQAERERDAAANRVTDADKAEQEAANALGRVLLEHTAAAPGSRSRRRTVAIAGEVLVVSDAGADYPDEFRISPVPVDVVPID
jgi:hypothetical protein